MSEVKYMRKKGESAVYIATEWLEKRDDMEFCDAPKSIKPVISDVISEVVSKPDIRSEPNVLHDTIYEISLAQKELAISEGLTAAPVNSNFTCTVESCGKAFRNLRALHMHGVGAHKIGRKVNV